MAVNPEFEMVASNNHGVIEGMYQECEYNSTFGERKIQDPQQNITRHG